MSKYVTNEHLDELKASLAEDIANATKTGIFVEAALMALTHVLVNKGVLGHEDAETFVALGKKFEEELLVKEVSRVLARIEAGGE